MRVLITGAKGFVGRNLVAILKRLSDVVIVEFDVDSPEHLLEEGLATADVVFHLAGVNRPEKMEDYEIGNAKFTQEVCDHLRAINRKPFIIFSSSIQAELDNPYGLSKRRAEESLLAYSDEVDGRAVIFRMKNVFGKWCRPDYNSVVATFCHNIARDLPVSISDRTNELSLVYIDDVCSAMMEAAGLARRPSRKHFLPLANSNYADVSPSFKISLGALVDAIYSFRNSRVSLNLPRFDDPLIRRLYATYTSYLQESDFAYHLDAKTDNRGSLAEFLKSQSFGQVFISRTKPGITRGNHYHHTKTEKFLVVEGDAVIRFRHMLGHEIIEYRVSGEEFRVVDIPPGYTHSIENVGGRELVTLFWAHRVFDPNAPDTYYEEV